MNNYFIGKKYKNKLILVLDDYSLQSGKWI